MGLGRANMLGDWSRENGIRESEEFPKTYMNVTLMRKCIVYLSLDSLNYHAAGQRNRCPDPRQGSYCISLVRD